MLRAGTHCTWLEWPAPARSSNPPCLQAQVNEQLCAVSTEVEAKTKACEEALAANAQLEVGR